MQGARLPATGFCGPCNGASRCRHAECTNPEAPSRKPFTSEGLCAEHTRDPAHEVERNWSRCSHHGYGCRHLSLKNGGGKCYACSEGNLPCANASRGCPAHVRHRQGGSASQRPTCTTHDNTTCPFDISRQHAVCATPFCGRNRANAASVLCGLCQSGRTPCSPVCPRRAAPNCNGRCGFCTEPHSAVSDTRTGTACIGARCRNLVSDAEYCSLCLSGSVPCQTPECPNRTSNSGGHCDSCTKATVPKVRLRK